jgi:hypothetical protein
MKIESYIRVLTDYENKLLRKEEIELNKVINKKSNYSNFLFSVVIFIFFGYLSYNLNDGFFKFFFGMVSVLSISYLIFSPKIYNDKLTNLKNKKQTLSNIISSNMVSVKHVKVNKIAIAQEYEDEGVLYIIELINKNVLFLWDLDYNFDKVLPCNEFEIYDNEFFEVTGLNLRKIGTEIKPIIIEKEDKWNYIKKNIVPDNLSVQELNFEELMLRIKMDNLLLEKTKF